MKFCTECGTKAEFDDQRFCKVCGHKFPEVPFTPENMQEPTAVILPGAAPQTPTAPTVPAPEADATVRAFPMPEAPETQPEETVYVPQAEDTVRVSQPESEEELPITAPEMQTERVQPEQFFVQPEQEEPEQDQPQKHKRHTKQKKHPAKESGTKKKFPVAVIVVILIVLVVAVGGIFAWKNFGNSGKVIVAGTAYNIQDTTSLTVTSPTSEDWTGIYELTGLTSLTINGGDNTELDENRLSKLSKLTALTELAVKDATFPDGLDGLEDLTDLEKLTMTNCQLTSEQCASLRWPSSLEELSLADNKLTDISFLENCTDLKALDISGNNIVDDTPLTNLAGLETLNVDHSRAKTLSLLPMLTSLTVNGKKADDAAAYVSDLKSITELYESIEGWFEQSDYSALQVVLQQYTDISQEGLSYADGWIMSGDGWDDIRASLPADTNEVALDSIGLYYGQMEDGKRSGQGTQMFAGNYSVYTGSWSNDLPNGNGTYRKSTADGTTLEFSGSYADGYENGTMTFTATNASGSQSGSYTAANGTRSTVKQLGQGQYAFIQFDTIYWYDASPENHGVAIGSIAYQEEKAVQVQPEPVAAAPSSTSTGSSSSKSSSSSKKSSSKGNNATQPSSSAQPSTPAPSQSAPAAQPSTPAASSSSSGNSSTEDTLKKIQEGVQTAKDVYDTAKAFYDMFN